MEKRQNVAVSQINTASKDLELKIIRLIEDILKCLERLETSRAKKKHFSNKSSAASRYHRTCVKSPAFPDVNAKPFISNAQTFVVADIKQPILRQSFSSIIIYLLINKGDA